MSDTQMELKELGDTGVKVPAIGLGTWQYRDGLEPLRKGIEQGASLIDTAEMYGTEGIVGDAVEGLRDQVFIATKVSGNHLRYDEVLRAAEGSLRRIGIDCIDLYQIHWPDPRVHIKETMRAMETLVDMGKVRFIGVSNFYLKDLQESQASLSKHKIVSNQVQYSLFQRGIEDALLPYCRKHYITVIAHTPLAEGALTARPLFKRRQATGLLQKVARECGKTMAQVALNWCIAKENVIAIPKSDKVERVLENCQAAGWRLSTEQMEALNRAFR
jgi:diketogulonate reductase-like aldo/keto reductase